MSNVTFDDFIPILEGVCYAHDYGKDSKKKAIELHNMLFPLGNKLDEISAYEALQGIIYKSFQIIKELECSNVITVEESSEENQDLLTIAKSVNQLKK